MRSFQEWREGGKTNSEVPIIRQVAQTFKQIEKLEGHVENLLDQLSRDHGPVIMALDKFKTSFLILQSTLKTAIEKHGENPERADHPPIDIPES